jgi:hypothetical protein
LSALTAPAILNTNTRSPTPSPTIAHTTPSSVSSTAPPPLAHITMTSTGTSQPCSRRALSPEDLALSPFAPPALPLPLPSTPSAKELIPLALTPPPAPLGLSLGHGLAVGQGHAPELDLGLSLGLGLGMPDVLVGVGVGTGGITPGPPVLQDWLLPHMLFAPAESSSSTGGSSGTGMYTPFAALYLSLSPSSFTDAFGAPFASTSAPSGPSAPSAAYPYQQQHQH